MNCEHCGAPIEKNDKMCPYCGSAVSIDVDKFEKEGHFFTQPVKVPSVENISNLDDNKSIVLNVIGFLFPVIGLIIYLIYRNKKPVMAESLKTWVIIGFIKDIFGGILDEPYNKVSSVRMILDAIK